MSKVHVIDGKKYVEVERKAKVGDMIVIVAAEDACDMYRDGSVLTVDDVTYRGVLVRKVATNGNQNGFICHREYKKLEPTTPTLAELVAQCTPENRHEEITFDSPDIHDLLANLARRVEYLERKANSHEAQLKDTQRNVETFAEQTENNSEDIRMLDDRTQPLVSKTVSVEPIIIDYDLTCYMHGETQLNVTFIGEPTEEVFAKVVSKVLNGGERR